MQFATGFFLRFEAYTISQTDSTEETKRKKKESNRIARVCLYVSLLIHEKHRNTQPIK